MKVILLNGSPNENGCTYTALSEMVDVFQAEGIETSIFQVGKKAISGCIDCGKCSALGKCVINDGVNAFLDEAATADGFVFGSPVHYASATGAITSFLDRTFRTDSSANLGRFALKPGAAILSARRGGTTAALEQLNKYFAITQMPIVASNYWNMVHGNTPEEVVQDLEGMQTMRILARNMAWLLKCKAAAIEAGIPMPKTEVRVKTNFIR